MNCTYRKTQGGTWAIFGPASIVKAGNTVQVRKANGDTVIERIDTVGKTFTANGVLCIYGYKAKTATRTRLTSTRDWIECPSCGEEHRAGTRHCWECGCAL